MQPGPDLRFIVDEQRTTFDVVKLWWFRYFTGTIQIAGALLMLTPWTLTVGCGDAPEASVFGDATGKPIAKRLFNRWWRATCDAAKIKDLNFHDLRHETGSQALEAGMSLHEVQAMLGDTTIGMTGRYLNATEKGLKKGFKKLEAARRRAKLKLA